MIVIQVAFDVAVQLQPAVAATVTFPEVPADGAVCAIGVTV